MDERAGQKNSAQATRGNERRGKKRAPRVADADHPAFVGSEILKGGEPGAFGGDGAARQRKRLVDESDFVFNTVSRRVIRNKYQEIY